MSLSTRFNQLSPMQLSALFTSLWLCTSLVACQSDEEKLATFLERANGYVEAEQQDEAIIEFRNVLQIDPNHVEAHEGLAKAYMQVGKYKEGYWELSETIRLDPSNVDARLGYAGVSLAAKRFEEVLEQAEAIIELDPELAAGYLLLGQSFSKLGREEEVEAQLLKAVELEPEESTYRLVIASYYRKSNEPQKALEQLLVAAENDPSPIVLTNLSHVYIALDGNEDAAEKALLRALELAWELTEEGEQHPHLKLAYGNLARFYFVRSEPEEEKGIAILVEGVEKVDNNIDLVRKLHVHYRETGQDDKADALIEEMAAKDPTDPGPYLTLSTVRASQGDWAGALAAAEQAVAADPVNIVARLRLAELNIDLGHRDGNDEQLAKGMQIVDEVLADAPSSPEALFVRSKVYISQGEYDQAIDMLRSAIDAKPNWSQAHFVLGSALILQGDKQRARAMLARAVELDPNVLAARRLLSEVHMQLGEYEYAVENGRVYIASLQEGEDDVEIRVLVAQSLMRLGRTEEAAETLAPLPDENPSVDLLYARGRILLAQQDLEPARELLLAANEMKPNNPRLLSSLYAIDRVTGKTSHSIKRINDAIEADPEVSGLWYLKGLVALEVGDQDGAEKSFKKSIDLDPNRLDAYQQLAALYQSTGRGDEMLTIYEQAIEAQPESAPSHHFLGVLYEMRGRTDDAKEQYELAIQYDPSLGESKNNLAYLLAERGEDLDTALKLAQEAKAAMPDSANAADTLGWVLYKRGVSSAAIGYLREALQVSDPDEPGRGEILNHLAMAYEAAGQNDKAVESLEAAVAGYERLKESGRMSREPAWLSTARTSIDRLKSAG